MFNLFPFSNLHELNLDWIVNKVLGIEAAQKSVEELTGDIDAAKEAATRADVAADRAVEAVSGVNQRITNHEQAINPHGITPQNIGAMPARTVRNDVVPGVTDLVTSDGIYKAVEAASGNVESVNGKTGVVVITAEDVGAMAEVEIDTAPLEGSDHLVTSGGVYAAIAGGGGGGGAVSSVNGKVGAVVLTAEDVGAAAVEGGALPNPHSLKFTGAVTAEYDGSEEVTVNIPQGGGGGGAVNDVQIGGTSILSDGVANIPAATAEFGVVKINSAFGINTTSAGVLAIVDASNGAIINRSRNIAVTAFKLPYAVKSVLCAAVSESDPAWSAEEQEAAQRRIGILSVEGVQF